MFDFNDVTQEINNKNNDIFYRYIVRTIRYKPM